MCGEWGKWMLASCFSHWVLQTDRTAVRDAVLLLSSEIRGKGACLCTQSSCQAGTEAGGTTSQTERAHSHTGRTFFCGVGWFKHSSLLLVTVFILIWNQLKTGGCPSPCLPTPNNVRIKGNLVFNIFPLLLTYILCWKEVSFLPHMLLGWDLFCLVWNIYLQAACLDHLIINGKKTKFIRLKLSDQFWTLTLVWGILYIKIFCIIYVSNWD